jgi:hypothetical protein
MVTGSQSRVWSGPDYSYIIEGSQPWADILPKMTDDEETDTQIIFSQTFQHAIKPHLTYLMLRKFMTDESPHIEEDSYKQVLTSTTSMITYDYVCVSISLSLYIYIYTHMFHVNF